MTLTAGKELPMVEKFVGNQTFFAIRHKKNSVQPRDVHVLWGPKGWPFISVTLRPHKFY